MKTTIASKLSTSVFAIFALILLSEISLQAGPGDLDATFGNGGKFTDWQGFAHAVAIQSDGKIVAAGQNQSPGCCPSFALTRYNTDGSLDTSFGTGGRVFKRNVVHLRIAGRHLLAALRPHR